MDLHLFISRRFYDWSKKSGKPVEFFIWKYPKYFICPFPDNYITEE